MTLTDRAFDTPVPSAPGGPPLLSIVTIIFNAREGFLETADSLGAELPAWCEWVVVDGGSSDGTTAEMERLAPRIARSVSEPDKGIADAFNKGIGMTSGDYVLFLNAGDTLLPGALGKIRQLLEDPATPPLVVGRIRLAGRDHGRPVSFAQQLRRNYLPHQASLIRRDLFATLGRYEESYRLGMDYEWSLRLQPVWPQIRFTDPVLAEMEPGGTSITNFRKTFAAYHRARMKHGHGVLASRAWQWGFTLKAGLGRWLRCA